MEIIKQQQHQLILTDSELIALQQLRQRLYILTYDEEDDFCLTQDEFVLLNSLSL